MKRFGDRRDGKLIRKIDSMHYIMPLIYPNRCDNEAFFRATIDLTAIDEYLKKKNENNPEYPYKLFQVIVAAALKTITLRPQMNRFICNNNLYQRNHVNAAFTVKKVFSDEGGETLARIECTAEDTLESIHDKVFKQVSFCKKHNDQSTDAMDVVQKLPFKHAIGSVVRFLDRHGWMPAPVVATDPYTCSIVLANIGSLKIDAPFHHLTNWGTTSIFCSVGLIKKRPFFDEEGNVTMKNSVELDLTIDERIADGYYYSKTLRLLEKLLNNPELLDQPFGTPVDLE